MPGHLKNSMVFIDRQVLLATTLLERLNIGFILRDGPYRWSLAVVFRTTAGDYYLCPDVLFLSCCTLLFCVSMYLCFVSDVCFLCLRVSKMVWECLSLALLGLS